MAKRTFVAGVTSQTMDIFIEDSSSTVGAGLAALVFNSAGLTCYYRKGATGTPTAVTLATQTVGGAWSSGGFVELDATHTKGLYRFDIPDTVLASTPYAMLYFYGATNMAPVIAELEIVSYNPFDAVRLGLTALPNAAAEASGGLYTRGAGAGQLSQSANGELGIATLAKTLTTYTGNTVQTGDAYARLGAPAGASQAADIAAVKVDTAAVKVQTDKLTFTVSNQVDSNVLDWKSATAPAMTGDAFARIGAAGVSLSAIPDLAGVTTLLSRLSAARAGYLDNVNNSALASTVAQTGDVYPKVDTEVATLLTAAAAIQAKTDNLPSDPADASDVAAALASLASTLATIASYIDTEVAAIKAKTDSLTFTAAGQVDANVQRINDVTLTGDGSTTPFGV